MAGYSTKVNESPRPAQAGWPHEGVGGYVKPGIYMQAGTAEGDPLKFAGGRKYQYSLDPSIEGDLQTIYGDIAGAQQAELGGIRDFIGSLEGAEQRGRRGIQAGLGRGMAAQWGGAGMGGRTSASQLRQAGLEGGLATAQFEAETLPAIAQSRYEAQALLAEKTMAIDAARTARMQEIQDMIHSLKDKHSNWFETDTRRVAEDLMAQAQYETDPTIRQYMISEAGRIRTTPANMFTVA